MISMSESHSAHITVARLYTERSFNATGGDLRRAVTALFPDEPLLHHHSRNGRADYSFSQIRYLVIDGIPHLAGLKQGRSVVSEIAHKLTCLTVGQHHYNVMGCDFIEDGTTIGITKDLLFYKSGSPWIALNKENLIRFNILKKKKEQRALLERILVGNFISLCKGLHLGISARIQARITTFRYRQIRTPVPLMGFSIQFAGNFLVPEFLGLGKMASKGFGLMKIV